ncbi:ATP-binding protein [Streptomyces sp. NBC_00704]|uniref:ATP-binding protein n=1 Tax=Streptomyces sp. NBC_00704 TaxID=2975809 RepID=UPI002E356818|nr:ATP-binding protein [Streptomyces sp. NBC_00704]
MQESVSSGTRPPARLPGQHFRNFSVRLSPTPRGARLARLLAVEQLRSWGAPVDPAGQIVAELAANAVTHGRVPGRDFRLTLYVIADTLRIEVTDTAGDRAPRPPCAPRPPHSGWDACAGVESGTGTDAEADACAESGRGLLLVEALADRWGWAAELRPRKTVWAEIVLAPDDVQPRRAT